MPPKNLFPALCASIVCLLASPSSSGKRFGALAQNATVTVLARPLYSRVLGDTDFGSPGGSTCGNCFIGESYCNGGCCPAGSSCTADRSRCCLQGANCIAPDPSRVCLDATADDCYAWVRVWALQVCCPASLPHCTSESGFGTGCFAASTTMPTTTSPQWNGLNTTKTSTSTSQPPDIIATIQSTIYVTKTVISHSGSVSSSMGNSATATPDNSAPDSTLHKISTITLISGIVIITSEPATILAPNNEPSEVQLPAVATSSVASMDKGLLPTTGYDPLDCSWFYFCTNFATISGTLIRVTYLCNTPLRTGQALAPRAAERVTTVTTTVTSIVTTITVTTTEVIEETEIPCTTIKSTLPLPSSSILTSQSLTASTGQNLSKTASSGTSELPASTIAGMSFLQSSSSSIMSMLNSVVSATSLLSRSGSGMMLSATSTVMSSAMASNSEIMGTGATAISSNSILTPNITPLISLCYDSEHNTNGPCSKTYSTGYYPGASVVPLGSNAFAGQKISCLVVSLVLLIHLALRV